MSSNQELETVMFRCLFCKKEGLVGKRNRVTREIVNSSSLLKHIQQKRIKGQLQCLQFYTEHGELKEIDLSSSLQEQYQDSERNSDVDSDNMEMDMDIVQSSDDAISLPEFKAYGILPYSNSLKANEHFATGMAQIKMLEKKPMPTEEKLTASTFPSLKLPPVIKFNTILLDAIQRRRNNAESPFILEVESSSEESSSEGETGDEASEDASQQEDDNQPIRQTAGTGTIDPPKTSYLLDRLKEEQQSRLDRSTELPSHVQVQLKLLQIQDKHKLSFAACEDLLKWAKFAHKVHPGAFEMKMPNRHMMMAQYRTSLGLKNDSYCFQETICTWLPDNKPIVLQRRPFLDCIYELLTKESLLGEGSCNISLPHPTNPYTGTSPEKPEFVSEVHHGTWWRKTFAMLCDGEKDMLCPLAFEVDETFKDTHGRLTITPFNIKLLVFNNRTNRREEASTTWFYLPNDDAEAAHHQSKTQPIHKIQNLHNALRTCFADLKYLMDNKLGIPWRLQYAGKLYDVNLKFAVALVISDTAMHDKLCCRYQPRTQMIQCICRHCNCPTDHLSSHRHMLRSKQFMPEDIDPTLHGTDPTYWSSISHHPVKNALDELCHGTNRAKTHLNTCGEVLHMHQKGAMVRVIDSFVFMWSKGSEITQDDVTMATKKKNIEKSLDNLNFVGHQMGAFLNRQSDRDKPRTRYKNSLFVTTKKNAHEQAGVLMCILLALLSDRGRQICFEERTMAEEWTENMVYIIELILMMEVWLKSDAFPAHLVLDSPRLGKALGLYMQRFTEICHRQGMGANTIKNHLILHLPQYILRWGPPSTWDSSNLERSHKTQAKRPADLTQKRPETFISQVAARYSDMRLVKRFREYFQSDSLMDDSLPGQETEPDHPPHSGNYPQSAGSRFTLGVTVGLNGRPKGGIRWTSQPGRQGHLQEAMDTAAMVILPHLSEESTKTVTGFTEYKTIIGQEVKIFRAHPSYRSASRQQRDVWYDWAMFDLPGRGRSPLPGQLLMFLDVPFLSDMVIHQGISLLPSKPHAVVRLFKEPPSTTFRGGQRYNGVVQPYSSLVRFGRVHRELFIIPCKYIVDTTIVVPNITVQRPLRVLETPAKKRLRLSLENKTSPLGDGFFVVLPRCEWGEQINNLIESFAAS